MCSVDTRNVACEFETGILNFKRRIPYSLGTEPLLPVHPLLLTPLHKINERFITSRVEKLVDSLVLNEEELKRRAQFVKKVDDILKKARPDHSLSVKVFGSTSSMLASRDADVDLCIVCDVKKSAPTTCELASIFSQNGMQQVVCIPRAKVPIVKFWDPEYKLASDCNINNILSISNTRMMRTYVDADIRVRQLIMIIKHWAKRRCLNDAAGGGTLTSYTLSCMIVNFLQMRRPPIVPSLQMMPHLQNESTIVEGMDASFFDDVDLVRGFGDRNTESVGTLLVEFFRFFGYSFDFEHGVLSVRRGTILSKRAKGWQFHVNNGFCVEEPFRTSRNLANTADDITVKGLQLEFRRAFHYLADESLFENAFAAFTFPSSGDESVSSSDIHMVGLSREPAISFVSQPGLPYFPYIADSGASKTSARTAPAPTPATAAKAMSASVSGNGPSYHPISDPSPSPTSSAGRQRTSSSYLFPSPPAPPCSNIAIPTAPYDGQPVMHPHGLSTSPFTTYVDPYTYAYYYSAQQQQQQHPFLKASPSYMDYSYPYVGNAGTGLNYANPGFGFWDSGSVATAAAVAADCSKMDFSSRRSSSKGKKSRKKNSSSSYSMASESVSLSSLDSNIASHFDGFMRKPSSKSSPTSTQPSLSPCHSSPELASPSLKLEDPAH
ncbi:poly(A) polymerase Cid13 [Schizosaccharomyces japonicus yFS275]|uniref:polynucleotide adenylyltransferase n=1 Tax=Schizosaccharomyces japonicus (strain yFS275 / FY16936) TaxID=402676 RepID=B6K868_SCHJY|nr:poly(A) polymerase Cid13 [Schizosaccharomyces japonicus yFS275]EEB09722.1 poly(A) polymerase Cid13 [Schizosaccharomyces japonicus yFS275]